MMSGCWVVVVMTGRVAEGLMLAGREEDDWMLAGRETGF